MGEHTAADDRPPIRQLSAPEVKALISFDAGVSIHARERGLATPLLLVRAEDPSYTAVFARGPRVNPRGTIYDSSFVRKLTVPMLDLLILGTGHGAILDRIMELQGPNAAVVDGEHAIIARYTIAFLKGVLGGNRALAVSGRDSARVRLQQVTIHDR